MQAMLQYCTNPIRYVSLHNVTLVTEKTVVCRLKPLDIEFMKQLHNKVNIVPVIAKADCLTKKEVQRLKTRVRTLFGNLFSSFNAICSLLFFNYFLSLTGYGRNRKGRHQNLPSARLRQRRRRRL